MDDLRWWKREPINRNQNDPQSEDEQPGDTNAADIVGRTGEEMPEVAHDQGRDEINDPPDGNVADDDFVKPPRSPRAGPD